MKFLPNKRLYWDAEYCLRFLRELETSNGDHSSPGERFHLYWHGPFSTKQAFAVKSLLATQKVGPGDVWLWLDKQDGYDGHERNPILQQLASDLLVLPFDPSVECRGTPVEDSPELYEGASAVARSDLFRLVALYKHGGVYLDLDMMLVRDLRELFRQPFASGELCCRWSAHLPYANTAFLRLRRESRTAQEILARCSAAGTCHPKDVLRFDGNERLDLTVLPCAVFDPLWPHADGQCRFEEAPLDRFDDFFRKFGWRFRPRQGIRTHNDFFPGAFAYHWHNQWDAREHQRSYYGRFARGFDEVCH